MRFMQPVGSAIHRKGVRPAIAGCLGLFVLASGPVSASAADLPAPSTPAPMVQPGKATVVGQLAGQATPGVPLLNNTMGTTNFDAGDLGLMWDDGAGHTMVAYGDSYGAGFQPAPGGGPANNDDHLCNTLARSSTPASSLSWSVTAPSATPWMATPIRSPRRQSSDGPTTGKPASTWASATETGHRTTAGRATTSISSTTSTRPSR
jgi:hypothetical protein